MECEGPNGGCLTIFQAQGGGGNQTSTNANVVQEHLVCCQAGDVRMERR